jgi:uncharacterized protein (TIGR00297 family)
MFANLETLTTWPIAIALNSVLIGLALLAPKKLLTTIGYLHAWALGVIIWGTLGVQGYAVVLAYFFVGSGLTFVRKAQKEAAGIGEARSGMRGPENVWGSAAVGAICALVLWAAPVIWPIAQVAQIQSLCELGYVASFATKLADTTASEIGKAFGKRTFLITTLKRVPRGTEGAVSLEGTIAGIIASIGLAAIGYGVKMISPKEAIICVVAAFVATNIESVIGATIQNRFNWLTNELVNVINTLIGAGVAIGLAILLRA